MKIYLARPISGRGYEETMNYFKTTAVVLKMMGYEVLHPLTGKNHLRNEIEFRAYGYDHPASTNHAIIERDHWMLSQADIVYANLEKTKTISIGTTMEIGWAYHLRKHTVVALEPTNPHMHAFILEAGDVISPSHFEAMHYLRSISPFGDKE